jgi:hypothetical protein
MGDSAKNGFGKFSQKFVIIIILLSHSHIKIKKLSPSYHDCDKMETMSGGAEGPKTISFDHFWPDLPPPLPRRMQTLILLYLYSLLCFLWHPATFCNILDGRPPDYLAIHTHLLI